MQCEGRAAHPGPGRGARLRSGLPGLEGRIDHAHDAVVVAAGAQLADVLGKPLVGGAAAVALGQHDLHVEALEELALDVAQARALDDGIGGRVGEDEAIDAAGIDLLQAALDVARGDDGEVEVVDVRLLGLDLELAGGGRRDVGALLRVQGEVDVEDRLLRVVEPTNGSVEDVGTLLASHAKFRTGSSSEARGAASRHRTSRRTAEAVAAALTRSVRPVPGTR